METEDGESKTMMPTNAFVSQSLQPTAAERGGLRLTSPEVRI
jgi:hypothetical protein